MMNSFTLLVALATVIAVCEGAVDISGIVIRQANTSTAGGFATRATTCSTTQVDCGGGVTQEICCPSNTFCFNSDDEVCCPTGESLNLLFFFSLLTPRRSIVQTWTAPPNSLLPLKWVSKLWKFTLSFLNMCDTVRWSYVVLVHRLSTQYS